MTGGLNLEYIAARRKELGLTQADMAARLGMAGAPDYNKYENGVYKLNAELIPSIAKVLECPIESLFTGEEKTDPTSEERLSRHNDEFHTIFRIEISANLGKIFPKWKQASRWTD